MWKLPMVKLINKLNREGDTEKQDNNLLMFSELDARPPLKSYL